MKLKEWLKSQDVCMSIITCFAGLSVVLLWGCFSTAVVQNSLERPTRAQVLPVTAKVVVQGKILELEVARTAEQISSGLMFREELPADRGMLFIYEPARVVRFWMRNVLSPLDMIFLREGEIIHIARSVPPCRGVICPAYGPDAPVDQVIELRGGGAEELGLAVGDSLRVEFLD